MKKIIKTTTNNYKQHEESTPELSNIKKIENRVEYARITVKDKSEKELSDINKHTIPGGECSIYDENIVYMG